MKADSSGKSRVPSPNATGRRRFPLAKNWVGAVSGLSGGLEGDMPRKNDSESSGTTRRRPRPADCRYGDGVAYNPRCGEMAACGSGTGWGRLSVDGPGHYNPDRSEGPGVRAVEPLERTAVP